MTRSARSYLDFIVDGTSLYQRLRSELPWLRDDIGCLGWWPPEEDERQALELLRDGPATGPEGRSAIYVCPECGDIECGAVTTRIERAVDFYVWRDFKYENTIDDEDAGVLESIALEPIRFNAADYRRAILSRRPTSYRGT